ncbi:MULTISPECIES: amidase [unclassified Microcoleus]|uniref:amidase n=1 Tax=unclassified Microcoleus TaxID=2642155 RepID=UPI0025DF9F8F|nr:MULTISPECIES: amidase [unclassified Microcoleus]
MNSVDRAFSSALDLAKSIRDREISPLEIANVYLERIDRLNHQLGSYFTVTADRAIELATAQTEHLAGLNKSEQLPPFFGVPIGIKDLTPVTGIPCTYGVQALHSNISPYNESVVWRIEAAGFNILGKTATSQIGSLPYSEPPGFRPARNPWNLEYTPGGSSGGSAAAVAAGLCAIAQGSDGGGSIRGPASACGLVGIKPSRGRVSWAPVGDYLSGISANGPLARTVADAAALLDVMSGYTTGDPYWLPDPNPTFLEASGQKLGKLRVAFSTSIAPVGEAAPVCQQAVLDTVKLLTDLGHDIEPGCPDFTGLIEPFTVIWQSGAAASGIPGKVLEPMNRWLLEKTVAAGEYLRAVNQMQVISRRIVGFFENFDVLVLPTYMHSPIGIGEWADLSCEETLQRIINWVAPCPPFNASGLPAIALPAILDDNGLPVGIQIIGRPAAEATLIALAAQIEAAKPFPVLDFQ